MTLASLEDFCKTLPGTVIDIKWGADLCFTVGSKMYCVTGLEGPFGASFRVTPDEFISLTTTRPGIIPAPYLARHHWVYVADAHALSPAEWQRYVRGSYQMVLDKLPKKLRAEVLG